ncbi:MAG: Rrf2 family transcriptional regulator [Eubacterium sp.]|nr:Rrf2 family transcriptional regulator [Eubacterium sp.]
MISTKGRYAIRVMIDLAEHVNDGYIPLKDTAARQGISKKYLEIIVKELVTSELVIGTSGRNGGYMLSRDPKDYTIGEIIESAEGPLTPVACLADPNYECDRKDICQTLPMWQEYETLVHDFFYSKHLTDLISTD